MCYGKQVKVIEMRGIITDWHIDACIWGLHRAAHHGCRHALGNQEVGYSMYACLAYQLSLLRGFLHTPLLCWDLFTEEGNGSGQGHDCSTMDS